MTFFYRVECGVPLLLAVLLISIGFGEEALQSISEEEAAEIIRVQEREKAEAYEIRRQRIESTEVLEQQVVHSGGRTLTINFVKPLSLDILATETDRESMQKQQLTATELRELLEQYVEKRHEMLFLGGSVYDGEVTELRWHHKGIAVRTFVNVDFNDLRVSHEIQSRQTVYALMFAIGDTTREKQAAFDRMAIERGVPGYQPKWVPQLSDFSGEDPEYLILLEEGEALPPKEAFEGLDALLVYYHSNKDQLAILRKNREKIEAAKRAYLEAHPPAPERTTINFWKIQ